MKIGALISYDRGMDFEKKFQDAIDIGVTSCQLSWWVPDDYTDEYAKKVLDACEKTGMEVSTVWAGWTGPAMWNFKFGPSTLGLVPPTYRFQRMQEIKKGVDFAEKIGVKNIATHVGFLPETPSDPDYVGTVAILKYLCQYMHGKGINFLFETGQETPTTMLRAIEDIGLDNVGVNFDTANLILYGKANSVDALDTLGPYVRDLHIKDACSYPPNGQMLGKEAPFGEGIVDFPKIIEKLKKYGYTGPLTIEREIEEGPEQTAQIKKAAEYLAKLWNS